MSFCHKRKVPTKLTWWALCSSNLKFGPLSSSSSSLMSNFPSPFVSSFSNKPSSCSLVYDILWDWERTGVRTGQCEEWTINVRRNHARCLMIKITVKTQLWNHNSCFKWFEFHNQVNESSIFSWTLNGVVQLLNLLARIRYTGRWSHCKGFCMWMFNLLRERNERHKQLQR